MAFLPQPQPDLPPQSSYFADEPLPTPTPPEEEKTFAPVQLTIKLDKEEREKLGRRILAEIDGWQTITERRRNALQQWRRDWECTPRGIRGPWAGSADVPSHLTRTICNGHQSRLNTQILNATPPFTGVANKPDAQEAVGVASDCLWSILQAADWQNVGNDNHHEMAVSGNSLVKVTYETETIRVPVVNVERDVDAEQGALLAGQPPHEAMWQGLKSVHFEHEDKVIFDGPRLKIVPFEDMCLLPATARDPNQCYGYGERYMIRGIELKRGKAEGIYYDEEVDRLLARQSDAQPAAQQERAQDQGLEIGSATPPAGEDDPDYREYQVWDLDWRGDFDGDGKQEWAKVLLEAEMGTLISCRYLEYEHGRSRYVPFGYIARPGQLLAMGIAELTAVYQDADSAVLAQLINHQDLVTNFLSGFAYDPSSGFDPDKFTADMGRGIKLDDINGIKFFQPPPLPAEAYQLSQNFKDRTDLLTASSNPSLGKTTDANKTLGEVQIALGATNMIFEDYAAGVARSWAKVWDRVRWLVAQFGVKDPVDGTITYRSTAAPDTDAFRQIDPQMLAADIDFVPAGLEQLSDMQTRIQQATMVWSLLKDDPLLQGNIPARLIMVKNLLTTMKYSDARPLMTEIEAWVKAQQAAAQIEQEMQGQMGQGAPGQPAQGALPPAAGAGPPTPNSQPPSPAGMGEPPPPAEITTPSGAQKAALGAGEPPPQIQ